MYFFLSMTGRKTPNFWKPLSKSVDHKTGSWNKSLSQILLIAKEQCEHWWRLQIWIPVSFDVVKSVLTVTSALWDVLSGLKLRWDWLPRWKFQGANLQARQWKHGFRSQTFTFKASPRCGSASCRSTRSAAPPQLCTFLSKQLNPAQPVNNWVSFFYYHHQSSILFWQEVAECLAPDPPRCNLI